MLQPAAANCLYGVLCTVKAAACKLLFCCCICWVNTHEHAASLKLLHESCCMQAAMYCILYMLLSTSCCMQAAACKLLQTNCCMQAAECCRRLADDHAWSHLQTGSHGFNQANQPTAPICWPHQCMYMYTITTTILRTLQITLTTTWLFIQCSNYLIKKKYASLKYCKMFLAVTTLILIIWSIHFLWILKIQSTVKFFL